ncbi:hypothetical protein RBY4I_1767 [Rhodobacterales bacterium Y4I]|nr:hypothetical protein RBY4I_1767 [Rhodobacterales bacterium Y4I]
MALSHQVRNRGAGQPSGCIRPGLVAKADERIASDCAYAMGQFDGKTAGESMDIPEK